MCTCEFLTYWMILTALDLIIDIQNIQVILIAGQSVLCKYNRK